MLKEEDIINGKEYYFVTDYSDYQDYSGSYITIIRPLEDGTEIDKDEVGAMWLAETRDGFRELNVYLDELYTDEKEYEVIL